MTSETRGTLITLARYALIMLALGGCALLVGFLLGSGLILFL